MVYQKLSVVHFWKDFKMYFRINLFQMFRLRFGNKSFKRPVPVVDISPMDGFKFVGVDGLVSVQNGPSAAIGIDLPAFVQQNVEVVGMEYPTPESGPMVAGPDIGALVVPEGID
jgi:hypothetical protein